MKVYSIAENFAKFVIAVLLHLVIFWVASQGSI